MNTLKFLVIISILSVFSTAGTAYAEAPRYIKVTSITMELDGPDATFTVEYKLDIVAKLYVLLLGSGNIEPAIKDIFKDFDNIQIISLQGNNAKVKCFNISYKDPAQSGDLDLYFHDSHKLGTVVDTFVLVYPSGITKEYFMVSATPNTFYPA